MATQTQNLSKTITFKEMMQLRRMLKNDSRSLKNARKKKAEKVR